MVIQFLFVTSMNKALKALGLILCKFVMLEIDKRTAFEK